MYRKSFLTKKNLLALICIYALFLSAQIVNAQNGYMKSEYNGLIATIAGGQTVGQSFVIDNSFDQNHNSFKFIEIHHQTTWESSVTLKIFEGTDYKGTPKYEQTKIPVTKGSTKNKKFRFNLSTEYGDLFFEKGKTYTITLTPHSNFRWNGDRQNSKKTVTALWPNNGGMWTKDFCYFYNIGTSKISTPSFTLGNTLNVDGAKIEIFKSNNTSASAITNISKIYTHMLKSLNPEYSPSKFDGFKTYVTNGESHFILSKLSPINGMWSSGKGSPNDMSRDWLRGGANANLVWVSEQMICKTGVATRNRESIQDTEVRTFDQVVHEFAHSIDFNFNLGDEIDELYKNKNSPKEHFAWAVQIWFGVPNRILTEKEETFMKKLFKADSRTLPCSCP